MLNKRFLYKLENFISKNFPKISIIFGFFMFFYIKFTKKNYSQFGEDIAILSHFKNLKISKGSYLDIGAFHPIWISNTYLLYKNEWNGVVVDLDFEKLKLFKLFRKYDLTINKAVVSSNFKNNKINYYKFNRFFSEINTVDKKFAIDKSKQTGFSYNIKKLDTVYINDLLNQFNNHLNFLNIDAEGIDEELILDIDFEKNKIDLICLESHDQNFKVGRLFKYLVKIEYELIYDSKPAYCFGRKLNL